MNKQSRLAHVRGIMALKDAMTMGATAMSAMAACVMMASVMTACVGDKGVAPAVRAPASTLGPIVVTPLNAIMAVGESLTVQVSGRTLDGAAIPAFDSVLYTLQNISDTLHVHVSPTGVVTALSASGTNNPVLVQVVAFKGGAARADLVLIQVTSDAIPGATVSIQPVPPDLATMAWGDTKELDPIIQNPVTGESVASPTVRYEYGPGDTTTFQCFIPTLLAVGDFSQAQLQLTDCGQNGNAAPLGYNQIHAFRKGTAWVHLKAWIYGVMQQDSVLYTISNPSSAPVVMGATQFLSSQPFRTSVFIAPGGTVSFINLFNPALGVSVAFTFDDPSAATSANPPSSVGGASGNITALQFRELSARVFNTPGVYTWTATVSGGVPPYTGATSTGVITVE